MASVSRQTRTHRRFLYLRAAFLLSDIGALWHTFRRRRREIGHRGRIEMFAKQKLFLVVIFLIFMPSFSWAKGCPADPYKASQAIWPLGALGWRQSATAMHPCGRKITCIGGRFDPDIKRSCHWD